MPAPLATEVTQMKARSKLGNHDRCCKHDRTLLDGARLMRILCEIEIGAQSEQLGGAVDRRRISSTFTSCKRYRHFLDVVFMHLARSQAVRGNAVPAVKRKAEEDRGSETFPPVTLGHIRSHGCRDLLVYCGSTNCNHRVTMNADWLPDETAVRSLCPRMVCTKCGLIGADVRPDWSPHVNKPRV
jgi:hypothetical protein